MEKNCLPFSQSVIQECRKQKNCVWRVQGNRRPTCNTHTQRRPKQGGFWLKLKMNGGGSNRKEEVSKCWLGTWDVLTCLWRRLSIHPTLEKGGFIREILLLPTDTAQLPCPSFQFSSISSCFYLTRSYALLSMRMQRKWKTGTRSALCLKWAFAHHREHVRVSIIVCREFSSEYGV